MKNTIIERTMPQNANPLKIEKTKNPIAATGVRQPRLVKNRVKFVEMTLTSL